MEFTQPDFSLESEVSINDDDCCEGCGQNAELMVVYSDAYDCQLLCNACSEAQTVSFRNELLNNACNE